MSYEGREVFLCEDGHIMLVDASVIDTQGLRFRLRCPAVVHSTRKCGKEWKWQYSIDDTNALGQLPELTIVERENIHKCRCGNTHLIESTKYAPADLLNAEKNGWRERGSKNGK